MLPAANFIGRAIPLLKVFLITLQLTIQQSFVYMYI